MKGGDGIDGVGMTCCEVLLGVGLELEASRITSMYRHKTSGHKYGIEVMF